jgi:flagellar assembly factor FliW
VIGGSPASGGVSLFVCLTQSKLCCSNRGVKMGVIDSTRLERLSFTDEEVIHVLTGILGFSRYQKYIIVEREEDFPFKWLHSVEDPSLALVVTDPFLFFPDYRIEPDQKDLDELQVKDQKELIIYVIVTVPADPDLTSANLMAPLVINPKKRIAKQLVLPRSPYTIKHYLFHQIIKRLRNN